MVFFRVVDHGQEKTAPLLEQVQNARSTGQALLLPGVYDALSARLAAAAGFEILYLTGAGLANARLGVPDIGLVSLEQLVDHVASISDRVDVPLVVDGDTGFGNAVNVTHVVRKLERAGASAIQLEDQVFPKKCGHFAGKAIVPTDEMVGKIRAAVDSRRSEGTAIIARTDARAIDGIDAAVDRAGQFLEAGADIIFVEAPTSVEELGQIARQIDAPLVANMVEGGSTPIVPLDELGQLGYSIVLYANAALRSAQYAVSRAYAELRVSGISTNLLDTMATWEERQNAVGKPEYDELEARYAS
jgi:2-methylisocitrate lyase-like PEP mutase family enzyme